MKSFQSLVFIGVVLSLFRGSLQRRMLLTTDELENHISPEDLREFLHYYGGNNSTTARYEYVSETDYQEVQDVTTPRSEAEVDCFGLGSISRTVLRLFNMRPDDAKKVNTHFYFSSRLQPHRFQVFPGDQFGLESVDFKPTRKTVMIVHGFMSHSNASWVLDMTRAFLEWGDVNVIAVDWSGGGNTWKYWRAVANTRRVGSDITRFLKQLMRATEAKVKDFHFIGHSLGAHISSFASFHCGRVARITGLDPAQPCFATANDEERLDATDADFVDIIHTNGRLLQKIGFGMPDPIGHVDFYPNGGLKQPGCYNGTRSLWSRWSFSPARLQQAICSHGRAYVLFTESLINGNCTFRAYRWDLSYEGVNASLNSTCDEKGSCADMGISATGFPKARGPYFLLTTDKEPYCVLPSWIHRFPLLEFLRDLRRSLMHFHTHTTTPASLPSSTEDDSDPNLIEDKSNDSTTNRSWFSRWFRKG